MSHVNLYIRMGFMETLKAFRSSYDSHDLIFFPAVFLDKVNG